ncbi:MAG: ABC transporter substrate-binding protein [Boseongicola sp.]|nr:ABC transporter substrate-binding protein [Boseongicola sp.]NNJ69350.1 ABC transporter substrate-binding protein [Boseongicola sp.]
MRQTFLSVGLTLLLLCSAGITSAFEIEDRARFGPEGDGPVLRIISTADTGFFEPMIVSYLAENPGLAVDYVVASSTELMQAIANQEAPFDIAISSAMDLQTKLANDGRALQHTSPATRTLPDWAAWNNMLFAFTEEPAAIVASRAAFADRRFPQTRHELIEVMRNEPERFRGRVGTYDVRESGLGYLFATQDTRASETFWRLAEVLGALDAKLYCCSSDMIEAVKSGELLIAYNVLGSYVANRKDIAEFEIILPTDFTTVMLRTALIPANAPSPDLSRDFVDHMLTRSYGPDSKPLVDPRLGLPGTDTALNRIEIGPGLMVFLDQLKRQAFLNEWENAILQDE